MKSNSLKLSYQGGQILRTMIEEILKSKVGVSNTISFEMIMSYLSSKDIPVSEDAVIEAIQQIRLTGTVDRLVVASNGYYVTPDCHEAESFINHVNLHISQVQAILNAINPEELLC